MNSLSLLEIQNQKPIAIVGFLVGFHVESPFNSLQICAFNLDKLTCVPIIIFKYGDRGTATIYPVLHMLSHIRFAQLHWSSFHEPP